jgi:hypothetical protein
MQARPRGDVQARPPWPGRPSPSGSERPLTLADWVADERFVLEFQVAGGRLAPVIGEFAKEYLHDDLRWIREVMVRKLDGLSEYDIRRPLTSSGTNLLGLLKHLATTLTKKRADRPRGSRGQLPPRPGQAARAVEAERHTGTGPEPAPPGTGTTQTRASLRVDRSRRDRVAPLRERSPGACARPTPGTA